LYTFFSASKNPFHFARKWEVEIGSPHPQTENRSRDNEELQLMMQSKFQQLENKFASLAELIQQNQNSEIPSTSGLQSMRGRGRGRSLNRGGSSRASERGSRGSQRSRSVQGSRRTRSFRGSAGRNRSQSSSISRAARERLNDFMTEATEQCHSEINSGPIQKETKTIFIKKIDCQINSTSIDQIDDKSDVDQSMQQYFRMSYFTGQLNSLYTNGISYEDFLRGYFFAVYDLSTSGRGAGSSFIVPSSRVGHLRLRYLFHFTFFKLQLIFKKENIIRDTRYCSIILQHNHQFLSFFTLKTITAIFI
jgi:hypothetical protein